MPLYKYKCECGNEGEFILPFDHPEQICKCGKVMQCKMTSSNFVMKLYARNMALDSINSKGGGFPDVNKHKSWVQQKAFEGV